MCISRLHDSCINEGSISVNNSDDRGRDIMHLDKDESGIVGSSVLRTIIFQDLVNCGLERPVFD